MVNLNPSLIEKILIGTGLLENLSTTALGLTTNVDEQYLTALISCSVASCIGAGASFTYRTIKEISKELNNY